MRSLRSPVPIWPLRCLRGRERGSGAFWFDEPWQGMDRQGRRGLVTL